MVIVEHRETVAIKTSEDVVRVRQSVRDQATKSGLSLVDQTKIITAASEIARNTINYGGGGEALVERLADGVKRGVRLVFSDKGPGIPDIPLAMTDGYTTGGGLGLGMSGAKRLSSEFAVESVVGQGTKVTLTRWK